MEEDEELKLGLKPSLHLTYCRRLGVASQPYSIYFYLNSEGLFKLHLLYMPINGFVADQVIFEVARFGERLPKRYVFKKSRDQKRWLILVGGMNHFQCYWRLFSDVLRVEFSHLVFL